MRIVFSGAGPTAIMTARQLIKKGHEVIIIELDKDKIDEISDDLDCSFLHGDAGKPAILSQVNPKNCDFLFCLTDNDQANIITSLLGRSMGFHRIITSIQDEDLVALCDELGLEDTIIPVRTMSQHLDNIVEGLDNIELSTLLKGSLRFFSFMASKEDEGKFNELDLPDNTRVIYYYRDDKFFFVEEDTQLRKGDEIVILTHSKHLSDLNERWKPKEINRED
ncbi:MAG: TrkA family potassium uptake protein [Desulfobacterales bacterium]|jgi:trk system potassium uptake protein TrkA